MSVTRHKIQHADHSLAPVSDGIGSAGMLGNDAGGSAQHSPLEGNVTLGDPLHVEAECGYGAMRVVSKGVLARSLFRISARCRILVAHTRS